MSEAWRTALARLQADDELLAEIANSDHRDARRFTRWLSHEFLPAIDVLGLRGAPGDGEYTWPGSTDEIEAMLAAAVNAARPLQ